MAAYIVAPAAVLGLEEIWAAIFGDNPSAADRLIVSMHDRFSLLSLNPLLGGHGDLNWVGATEYLRSVPT
jgi:plasmid stabilization system protein ParE